LARMATESYDNIILAGGLDPTNVAKAIDNVKPYGIDLSSGVEAEKRKKCLEKMSALFGAIRVTV